MLDFPGLPSEAEPLCQSQVEVAACTFDASSSSWFTEYQMSSGTGGAEKVALGTGKGLGEPASLPGGTCASAALWEIQLRLPHF